ncbi:hypothetical protein U9R90_06475 [Streptomyces sp. E11-3]|uniref:hypothetical protein n=1 Tax=Streptomyces sp. E11-3 TaxID=3110112 RepID=UPI0039818B31
MALLPLAVCLALGLGAVAGCSEDTGVRVADGTVGDSAEDRAAELAERARKVAKSWDGSAAADAWRGGYHPVGEITRFPEGGWRSEADKDAYQGQSAILHGALPATGPRRGQVEWKDGDTLTRPMNSAKQSYRTLTAGVKPHKGQPYLTVTGVELGEMTVATTRGPATVPAWEFTLDGYDTPLKRAAVPASKLPALPVKSSRGTVPGQEIIQLVKASGDGRRLTVVAGYGACDNGPVVTILETTGSVVLIGDVDEREDSKDAICTKELLTRQVTVKLDKPLGDRVLLDATTGKPVPFRPLLGPLTSWS